MTIRPRHNKKPNPIAWKHLPVAPQPPQPPHTTGDDVTRCPVTLAQVGLGEKLTGAQNCGSIATGWTQGGGRVHYSSRWVTRGWFARTRCFLRAFSLWHRLLLLLSSTPVAEGWYVLARIRSPWGGWWGCGSFVIGVELIRLWWYGGVFSLRCSHFGWSCGVDVLLGWCGYVNSHTVCIYEFIAYLWQALYIKLFNFHEK